MKNKTLIILLAIIGIIVFSYFYLCRYYDTENGCNIKIRFSFLEFSNLSIKKALKVLKYGAPEEYSQVCKNITAIGTDISCGGFGGGCFELKPGQITISTAGNGFLGWTTAVIVHEACHNMQQKEGRNLSEEECYEKDSEVLQKIVEL
jgi:hypothetical protein